jgi:hypothetical protein
MLKNQARTPTSRKNHQTPSISRFLTAPPEKTDKVRQLAIMRKPIQNSNPD